MKIKIMSADNEIFVVADGVRIAKRGKPGTPQTKTWISLEPGWEVFSNADHSKITIEHNGVRLQ
jgi:predicted peroxiredoxin